MGTRGERGIQRREIWERDKAGHLSRLGRVGELGGPVYGRKQVYLEKQQGVQW